MCVKPHSPDLNRGALATDARGCSPLRYLLELPASHAGSPGFATLLVSGCGPVSGGYIGAVTRTGVRFRGVSVTDCV